MQRNAAQFCSQQTEVYRAEQRVSESACKQTHSVLTWRQVIHETLVMKAEQTQLSVTRGTELRSSRDVVRVGSPVRLLMLCRAGGEVRVTAWVSAEAGWVQDGTGLGLGSGELGLGVESAAWVVRLKIRVTHSSPPSCPSWRSAC